MTNEQIEKALELCASPEGDCCALGCPYAIFLKTQSCKLCMDILADDALALIKRQKEEIALLNKDKDRLAEIVGTDIARVRTEAIREFAERVDGVLDLFAKGLIEELELYDKIAELKKEMTEEQK